MDWLMTSLVRWSGGPEDKARRYEWAASHPARMSLMFTAVMCGFFSVFAVVLSASPHAIVVAVAVGFPVIFVAYYVAIRVARRATA